MAGVGDGTNAHAGTITLIPPTGAPPYTVLPMPISGTTLSPASATISSLTGDQFALGDYSYFYAGIVQIFPTQITLTKAYGAMAFENSNPLFFPDFTATFQAQLYHYSIQGGGATFAPVAGAVCEFSPTGGGGVNYEFVLPGFSNSCSNTSFSETFHPGDGAFWVVSGKASLFPGQSYQDPGPISLDVSMSVSE